MRQSRPSKRLRWIQYGVPLCLLPVLRHVLLGYVQRGGAGKLESAAFRRDGELHRCSRWCGRADRHRDLSRHHRLVRDAAGGGRHPATAGRWPVGSCRPGRSMRRTSPAGGEWRSDRPPAAAGGDRGHPVARVGSPTGGWYECWVWANFSAALPLLAFRTTQGPGGTRSESLPMTPQHPILYDNQYTVRSRGVGRPPLRGRDATLKARAICWNINACSAIGVQPIAHPGAWCRLRRVPADVARLTAQRDHRWIGHQPDADNAARQEPRHLHPGQPG